MQIGHGGTTTEKKWAHRRQAPAVAVIAGSLLSAITVVMRTLGL
jgi:hypothetical protein